MSKTPLPMKGLGAAGIITDIPAYDLPLNAWSRGNNVAFNDGKLMRATSFRVLEDTITPTTPVSMTGVQPSAGSDYLLYAGNDGSMYKWASGTEADVTNAAFTPAVLTSQYTHVRTGEITYFNRDGVIPYFYGPDTSLFTPMSGWTSTHSCKALREFKDHLIAINVTKAGTNYPNMIKTSDTIIDDTGAMSWDHTSLATNCIERQLAALPELVDGLTLGNSFMLYGNTEVWRMELVGGKYIYSTRKAFSGPGCIGQNCVIEHGGYHYVFGANDIYRHDGSRWESIADERTRQFIYTNLNLGDSHKFFVLHDAAASEIKFCYISGDAEVNLPGTTYCNKAAIYNYINNTWSFMDLPNVTGWGFANVNQQLTYANATQTYTGIGGSYFDQESATDYSVCLLSVADAANGLTVNKLLGMDLADRGTLAYPIDTEAEYPAWIERTGLDLDELGLPSRTMKLMSNFLPKFKTYNGNTIDVEVGGHDIPEGTVTWQASQTFDPATDYKLDVMATGRYLAVRITQPVSADFELQQYDLEVSQLGDR